ncbi:succinylglutamate desuccinylase/aspartoacylase family protein [Acidocella sp.]|uniref:succinylglutamate desuccinylase/aspartoacylase domain-containing protein n=1 Tax=Acidocella sp. TaxID=50710 RepID=UPI002603F572|nr:succinylglutamate desuccinylase/aspartoacylase family protein [Acidocella sp.]
MTLGPTRAEPSPPPPDLPVFEVAIRPPDLSPYLAGNTGVPGFTTLDSGRAGPHVVAVSLIHGNEIAPAIVLAELLEQGFRPARGRLTLGFANLAAFALFDPACPLASRFVEEDMNRVWDDFTLFGMRRSVELERAREIKPIIDAADMLLDMHTMLWPSEPLLLCGAGPRGRALGREVATPGLLVADSGHAGGKRLIDYGRFTETAPQGAACLLVEAGPHWRPEAVAQSRATLRALLRHAGMAEAPPPPAPPRFAEVVRLVTARTNRFVFTRAFRGGEIIPRAGTLIAHDGDEEIRTPEDDLIMIMPSLKVGYGHTAVRLARLARD